MRPSQLLTLLIFLTASFPSFAFQIDDYGDEIYQNMQPLKVSGDAIKWEVFFATKEKDECTIDEEGFDYCITKPIYSPQIKSLHNTEVTLTGFMFPLESTTKQKNFLLGPFPPGCPFHYHVSPSQMVEVNLKDPIAFSFDPITVKGVLSLDFNEETGVFYYLKNN